MARRRRHEPEDGSADTLLSFPRSTKSLTAAKLLAAQPTLSGTLSKRSKRCAGLCPSICKPKWQARLFVLAGTFLFRYKDETSISTKGAPVPCESITCEISDDSADFGYEFTIATLRKTYTVRAETAEERTQW